MPREQEHEGKVLFWAKVESESTEVERGLKKGQGGLIWALRVHMPTQCVAFFPGISQTCKYVHMSHSTVFLGSD